MTTTPAPSMSAADVRRRVRQSQNLQLKIREHAAASVLSARKAAEEAGKAKEKADLASREAIAATLRLFGNDAELVAGLLDIPAEELEREAKPVTAARAKEVVEQIRRHAERPRPRRTKSGGQPIPAVEPSAPGTTEQGQRAGSSDGA
ncbi:hypothetical protein ACFRJ1_19245 [Streptomyces sp. NPDC056773]|uniref:hypothetical protein n=1 Tax=unclassified Streptomyces TaxID=2593676 RepID=UPI0036C61D3D